MSHQWHDDDDEERAVAQVRDDDDEAPDDWEAELDKVCSSNSFLFFNIFFQPEPVKIEAKPKPSASAKSSTKVIHEPQGDFTPEQMDQMEQKEELQKEHDKINMAAELVTKDGPHQSLDNMNLINRDEFLNYSQLLSSHLDILGKSEFYPDFLEHFLNGITQSMSTESVKHLTTTLQTIIIRKQGEERERKSKAKTKKAAKPQLKTIRRTDYGAFGGDDDEQDFDPDDDYDDFI